MLIGLISDTHIPDRARILPTKVIEAFEDVELIIHAGDLTSPKVIEDLEEIAPVLRIGAIHGEVYPRADSDQLLYLAKELDVDILVSGHSHQPKIEQKEGILLLNPGSPIVPRLADRTVMLLDINNRQVDVEIVKIGSPVCSALDFDQYKRD